MWNDWVSLRSNNTCCQISCFLKTTAKKLGLIHCWFPNLKVGGPVSPGPHGCCAYANIILYKTFTNSNKHIVLFFVKQRVKLDTWTWSKTSLGILRETSLHHRSTSGADWWTTERRRMWTSSSTDISINRRTAFHQTVSYALLLAETARQLASLRIDLLVGYYSANVYCANTLNC